MDYATAAVSPTDTIRMVSDLGRPSSALYAYTECSSCSQRELCLPRGLDREGMQRIDELVYARKRVKSGTTVYEAGTPFWSLYAVRSGFLKTSVINDDGKEQVIEFQMSGDIIGFDGIDSDKHTVTVVALEDSEICVIPYARLEAMSQKILTLRRQIHRTMAGAIVRHHAMMMVLGSMRAEERVASFLIDISQRFVARGYAASDFRLRMTRQEIGSYLGLKLETVSRILSRFQELGLLLVKQRHIHIVDMQGLQGVKNETVH